MGWGAIKLSRSVAPIVSNSHHANLFCKTSITCSLELWNQTRGDVRLVHLSNTSAKNASPTTRPSCLRVEGWEYLDPSSRSPPTTPSTIYWPIMSHCNVRGCHRKTVYEFIGVVKKRSRFCQEHTCQGDRDAIGFCQTQRIPAYKCCPAHGKCRVPGCILLAPRSVSNEDLPWTCPPREYIIVIQCCDMSWWTVIS